MDRMTEYRIDPFGIKRAVLVEETPKSICTGCGENCETCSFKREVERLAAYEDTGMEPEEVEQIKNAAEHMMFEDVAHFVRYALINFDELQKYKAFGDYNRLCELARAALRREQDG